MFCVAVKLASWLENKNPDSVWEQICGENAWIQE
jgi:hypothetical protein